MNRSNIGLFLASLLVAVALYIQVQPLATTERELEFTAPLVLNDLPDQLAVTDVPASVRLLATGTPEELREFDTSTVRASLNLASAKPGPGRYVVQVTFSEPTNLRVIPRDTNVQLIIEQRTERRIPVDFESIGTLPNLYTFSGATLQPESVTVSGPESMVSRVVRARVILNLSNARPQGAYQLEVEALGEDDRPVPNVVVSPIAVTVSPAIASAPVGKQVLINLNLKGPPANGYRIANYSVMPNSVNVTGDPSALAMFNVVETRAFDISGATSDRTGEVDLVLPNGVEATLTKVRVTVNIERAR